MAPSRDWCFPDDVPVGTPLRRCIRFRTQSVPVLTSPSWPIFRMNERAITENQNSDRDARVESLHEPPPNNCRHPVGPLEHRLNPGFTDGRAHLDIAVPTRSKYTRPGNSSTRKTM